MNAPNHPNNSIDSDHTGEISTGTFKISENGDAAATDSIGGTVCGEY